MTDEMMSKYKELGGITDVDYPKNENVFSWNRDSPFIRPEAYKCSNCNHSLIGRERCDGRKCKNCGYPIKLYGYPDLVHDPFFDMNEVPYDFEENGYNMGTQHEYVDLGRDHEKDIPIMIDSESTENGMMGKVQPMTQPIHTSEHVQLPDNYVEVEETKEHMNGSSSTSDYLYIFVTGRICLFFVAILIAEVRGELKKGGEINWSLVACVFLFPDIYFAYVIFEWLVRPKNC